MVKRVSYCVVCGRSDLQQGALLPEPGGAVCYPCYVDKAKPVGQPCLACGWELYCWPIDKVDTGRPAYTTVYCPQCKAHYMACRECGAPTKTIVYFFSKVVLCVTCSKKYDYQAFKEKYGSLYGSIGQDIHVTPGGNDFNWVSDGTKD